MRTQLSGWQIRGRDGDDSAMKYVELTHVTISHVANAIETYRIPFPEALDGLSIKTIKVVSEQNLKFVVDIMDGETTDSIYESLEEIKFHYDQVDIPYRPSERALFVRIHNKGSVTTKFTITVKGIEVK